MRNRFLLLLCVMAVVPAACRKNDNYHEPPVYDDAAYLMDGLVKEVSGEYIPIRGTFFSGSLRIKVGTLSEAEEHFLSLLPPDATVRREAGATVWSMTDGEGKPQGDAVFKPAEDPHLAELTLPESFPQSLRTVAYATSSGMFSAVDQSVRDDLEDNYFYGAIVEISNHGCGSGKFVVLREYNFDTGAAGMAIRLDGRRWSTSEMNKGSTESDIAARASCLSTMRTAGEILRKDMTLLTKQLRNAGSRNPDQHFYSSNKSFTGLHYYYCLHDEECDTIGPFHDLEFYECWIYWFVPNGSKINFW